MQKSCTSAVPSLLIPYLLKLRFVSMMRHWLDRKSFRILSVRSLYSSIMTDRQVTFGRSLLSLLGMIYTQSYISTKGLFNARTINFVRMTNLRFFYDRTKYNGRSLNLIYNRTIFYIYQSDIGNDQMQKKNV